MSDEACKNSPILVSEENEFLSGEIELPARLSRRQQEIASLLVSTGLSCKQLADRLGLSEGTVRKHTEQIYRALHVHSRPELVALLRKAGAQCGILRNSAYRLPSAATVTSSDQSPE